MAELDLDAINARAIEATPGPWRVSVSGYSVKSQDNRMPIVCGVPGGADADKKIFERGWTDNAELIAHAREDVPALVAEVRRLKAGTDALNDHSAALSRTLEDLRRDLRDAAGECKVPVPEPGSDMARLLSANVLLKAEVRGERAEIERLEKRLALAIEMMRTAHAAAAHAIERRRNPGGQQAGSDRWAGVSFGALTEFERDVRHAIELLEADR